jgi:hypothetical protein
MKYTRYDYRKKRNDSFTLIIVLISVLVIAYLLGTGLSSLFIRRSNAAADVSEQKNPEKTTNVSQEKASEKTNEKVDNKAKQEGQANQLEKQSQVGGVIKFVCVQNGVFSKQKNADEFKNKLKEYTIPFIVNDGDKIYVMSTILHEEESEKFMNMLTESDIPNLKKVFEIDKSDVCNAEIAEIISGYIKILNKLGEKDVTAVHTEDFKKWMNSLQAVEEKSKNYNILEELKKYINGLPNELSKQKLEENYVKVYTILKKAGS